MLPPSCERNPSRVFSAFAATAALLFLMFQMSRGPDVAVSPEPSANPPGQAAPTIDARPVSMFEFGDPLLPSMEEIGGGREEAANASDVPGVECIPGVPHQTTPKAQGTSPAPAFVGSGPNAFRAPPAREPKVYDVGPKGRSLPRGNAPADTARQKADPPPVSTIAPARPRRPLTYAETQTLKSSTTIADRLARSGADAFRRSLMPLEDYAQQLESVLEIRKSQARLQQNDAALVTALTDHLTQLQRATAQLRSMKQPASAGWQSKSLLAELLAANTRIELAEAANDAAGAEDWQRRARVLASEHLESRMRDYREFGHASLGDMMRAVSFLSTNTGQQAGASDQRLNSGALSSYAGFLQRVVEMSETFEKRGAGIGRADKVEMARYELARIQGLAALSQNDNAAAKAAFQRSAGAARKMFDTRTEYYGRGTAGLHDVAEAWRLLRHADSVLPDNPDARRDSNQRLDRLMKMADSVSDLRGRNQADVAEVGALDAVRRLHRIERDIMGESAKDAPKRAPAQTPDSPRVKTFRPVRNVGSAVYPDPRS
jgi:hypothetical protein